MGYGNGFVCTYSLLGFIRWLLLDVSRWWNALRDIRKTYQIHVTSSCLNVRYVYEYVHHSQTTNDKLEFSLEMIHVKTYTKVQLSTSSLCQNWDWDRFGNPMQMIFILTVKVLKYGAKKQKICQTNSHILLKLKFKIGVWPWCWFYVTH